MNVIEIVLVKKLIMDVVVNIVEVSVVTIVLSVCHIRETFLLNVSRNLNQSKVEHILS